MSYLDIYLIGFVIWSFITLIRVARITSGVMGFGHWLGVPLGGLLWPIELPLEVIKFFVEIYTPRR